LGLQKKGGGGLGKPDLAPIIVARAMGGSKRKKRQRRGSIGSRSVWRWKRGYGEHTEGVAVIVFSDAYKKGKKEDTKVRLSTSHPQERDLTSSSL